MICDCIIIDDEFLARQLLEGYVNKVPFLNLSGQFGSALEAMESIQDTLPSLIFLDINMPDLNGLEFIKTLQSKPEIIITSAYSEYALEGYQLDVVDYLLKPIYFERFMLAARKAHDLIQLKNNANQRPLIKAPDTTSTPGYVFLKTNKHKIVKVYLEDIYYIESLREYIRIHLKDKNHVILHSLKNLLDLLPSDQFIQVHRSHIVNFDKIEALDGNELILDEFTLKVSKHFRNELFQKFRKMGIGIKTPKPKEGKD